MTTLKLIGIALVLLAVLYVVVKQWFYGKN
jgi:hypothetical protein